MKSQHTIFDHFFLMESIKTYPANVTCATVVIGKSIYQVFDFSILKYMGEVCNGVFINQKLMDGMFI